MPKPFETSEATRPEDEATKPEEETISDAPAEKRIERVADKAAEKSMKTEQRYDRDHNIFSK
jgi:hypothetical protein